MPPTIAPSSWQRLDLSEDRWPLPSFRGIFYRRIGLHWYSCVPEIAATTGCPADTVKTSTFHAQRQLKAVLADRGEETT